MGKNIKSKQDPSSSKSSNLHSSNWKALQKSLPASSKQSQRFVSNKKRKSIKRQEAMAQPQQGSLSRDQGSGSHLAQSLLNVLDPQAEGSSKSEEAGKYVAIDCEFVGVGGQFNERSALARVSLVNYHGHCLLDTFVRQKERVTDYRTWVSGVRAQDLNNAPTFETVVKQTADVLQGRILVGHAVHNDLQVLLLSHPAKSTRDTSSFKPLQELAKTKRPSLRNLAKLVLNIDIQSGEHSSVEDARATMAVFRAYKDQWDAQLAGKAAPKPTPVHPRAGIDPSRRYRHSKSLGLASVAIDAGLVSMPEKQQDPQDQQQAPEAKAQDGVDPVQARKKQQDDQVVQEEADNLFSQDDSRPSRGRKPAVANAPPPEKRSRPPPSQSNWWL